MGRDRIFFVSVMTSPFFTLDSILSRKIMDFGYVHTFGGVGGVFSLCDSSVFLLALHTTRD